MLVLALPACLLCVGCSYALSETFLVVPVALLIGIPAYQVFIKGDTRSGPSEGGALSEGLASGDGLAGQSDKIDLNEPAAVEDGGGGGGEEPSGPPPTVPSDGPITAL